MPALIDRARTLDWMSPPDEEASCLAGAALDVKCPENWPCPPAPVAWEDDDEDEDDEEFLDDDDDLDLGDDDEEFLDDDEDDEEFDDDEEPAEEGDD